MVSTGAPLSRSASVRSPSPPPSVCACNRRVIVSGLYWKTIRLASGLRMSMPTRAPFITRGEPGKVVMAVLSWNRCSMRAALTGGVRHVFSRQAPGEAFEAEGVGTPQGVAMRHMEPDVERLVENRSRTLRRLVPEKLAEDQEPVGGTGKREVIRFAVGGVATHQGDPRATAAHVAQIAALQDLPHAREAISLLFDQVEMGWIREREPELLLQDRVEARVHGIAGSREQKVDLEQQLGPEGQGDRFCVCGCNGGDGLVTGQIGIDQPGAVAGDVSRTHGALEGTGSPPGEPRAPAWRQGRIDRPLGPLGGVLKGGAGPRIHGELALGRAAVLLDHMGQLMSQKTPSRGGARRVLPAVEHHVPPYRVRQRADRPRRLGGPRVVVHAHPAEVVTQPGFHEGTGLSVQRSAWRAEDLVHDRRRCRGAPQAGLLALQIEPLLLALGAFAARSGSAAAGAFALQQPARDGSRDRRGGL